jgi:hypothetical protein
VISAFPLNVGFFLRFVLYHLLAEAYDLALSLLLFEPDPCSWVAPALIIRSDALALVSQDDST